MGTRALPKPWIMAQELSGLPECRIFERKAGKPAWFGRKPLGHGADARWTAKGSLVRPFSQMDHCSGLGTRKVFNAIQECSGPAPSATVVRVIPPFSLDKTKFGAGVAWGAKGRSGWLTSLGSIAKSLHGHQCKRHWDNQRALNGQSQRQCGTDDARMHCRRQIWVSDPVSPRRNRCN